MGSLLAAVGSYLDARHQGGEWLVRIEDIDRAREQPGAADDILRTLEAYGLHWDGPVLYQHTRVEAYREVLNRLIAKGQVYACDCQRRDYAPEGTGEARYPGRCRHRHPAPSGAVAWRLNTFGSAPIGIQDRAHGSYTQDVSAEVGDFVLWRKDGYPAYQLAVVVDDAWQGITDVVRGLDLLDNTPRQRLLQQTLHLPSPATLHLPLVMDTSGEKLSKSRQALPVATEARPRMLKAILEALGQTVPKELAGAPVDELLGHAIRHWDVSALKGKKIADFDLRDGT